MRFVTFPALAVLLALAGCGPLGSGLEEGVDVPGPATPTRGAAASGATGTPEPQASAVPTSEIEPAVPDLVWLPFSSGVDDSRSVLVVRSNQVGFETSPVDFSLYWDYSGITGRLAYASEFWHAAEGSNRSVSDLWVYDYTSGECQGVFLVSVKDGLVTEISDQLALSGGWIGDRPVWAERQGALLFPGYTPESIFWVVPLDGSGAFQPAMSPSIGEEYSPSPMHALWSAEHRTLIGQVEGMEDPFGVWAYTFSQDLRTIEQAYRVNWGDYRHDLILVDWWEPGESVLVRDITNTSELNPFGVAVVWDIGERSAFELASSRPVIEVPVHPPEARTGVEPVDRVIQIFLAPAFDQRTNLIRTRTTGCTTTEYFVGPPRCRAGQVEGTLVEVFPYRMYRASHYAASDELEALLQFPLEGVYAVYK